MTRNRKLPAIERAALMKRLVGFGKDVLNGWLNAEAFTLAAALAYYAIFPRVFPHLGRSFSDKQVQFSLLPETRNANSMLRRGVIKVPRPRYSNVAH